MFEAGMFAGYEARSVRTPSGFYRSGGFGGPFDALSSTFSLLTNLSGVISQLYLLYAALSGGKLGRLGWSSALLIALSLGPSLSQAFAGIVRPSGSKQARASRISSRQKEQDVKAMGKNGEFKQEVLLFGLKDWVLAKWDRMRVDKESERINEQRGFEGFEFGLGMVQEGAQTSFYVSLLIGS